LSTVFLCQFVVKMEEKQ